MKKNELEMVYNQETNKIILYMPNVAIKKVAEVISSGGKFYLKGIGHIYITRYKRKNNVQKSNKVISMFKSHIRLSAKFKPLLKK